MGRNAQVLAANVLSPEQRRLLEQQVRTLDPIALAHDIERTLDTLWKLADSRQSNTEAARG